MRLEVIKVPDLIKKQEGSETTDSQKLGLKDVVFWKWIILYAVIILVPFIFIINFWTKVKPPSEIFISLLLSYVVIVGMTLWPVLRKKD